jgi:hypothetical protein
MKDPNGERPDTKIWLRNVNIKDVVGWSAEDVSSVAAQLIHKNPLCHALGDGTADSALAAIRASDIEISDTGRYEQWAEAAWGVPFTTRLNVSQKFVDKTTDNQVERACSEDIKLYATIMNALGDQLMMRGSEI